MTRTLWKLLALTMVPPIAVVLICMLPIGYASRFTYAVAKKIADAALACFTWAAEKGGVR